MIGPGSRPRGRAASRRLAALVEVLATGHDLQADARERGSLLGQEGMAVRRRGRGTSSNGEPSNASRRSLRSGAARPTTSATRASTASRRCEGRSAGRTATVHVGTLTTNGRPSRSNISPRCAGIATGTECAAAACSARTAPSMTWSWNSRPARTEKRRMAMTPKATNVPRAVATRDARRRRPPLGHHRLTSEPVHRGAATRNRTTASTPFTRALGTRSGTRSCGRRAAPVHRA